MPLIDGIGDEVVHFAAVVVVMAVAALAWWSTNARPDRYRTVLLMRSHAHHPVTLSIRTGAPPSTMVYTNRQPNGSGEPTTETVTVTSPTTAIESSPSSNNEDVVPLQEMDSIVDADMALLDHNRLHFYRRVSSPRAAHTSAESTSDEGETREESEPASNAQIREMDSIVTAMEGDESADCDVFTRPSANDTNSTTLITRVKKEKPPPADNQKKDEKESTAQETTDGNAEGDNAVNAALDNNIQSVIPDDRKILIKLKYLNDTQREVEGSLDELLKDFKWRHFSSELASQRVRLIFNGRVLCDEGASLRALGLHHRAVVHCLVHPKRTHTQRGGGAGATSGREGGARAPERGWDLENILMTLVSVALTVVWFFRCEYSNMFTASASVALFGLTVFYSVAIFGLYLSDTFQFDRRQPQPLPNN